MLFLKNTQVCVCVFISFVCLGLFYFMEPGLCTLQTSALPLSVLPSTLIFFCISNSQRNESHYYLSMARRAVSQHLFTLKKRPSVCELRRTLLYSLCEPCWRPSPKKPPARVPLGCKPGMVAHTCNSSSWETGAGGSHF